MNIAGLIVGLGNPGKEYEHTRHNLGFMAVDALLDVAARQPGGGCEHLAGGRKKYDLWRCRIPPAAAPWLAAKPQTFMNLSGEAVLAIASYYRVHPSAILVVHDELDIPLGHMKFKTGGGNAGHNGLKSITQSLGTPDFHRLRLGIGRSPHGADATSWVLGRFSGPERARLDTLLPAAVQAMITFAASGAAAAVQCISACKTG